MSEAGKTAMDRVADFGLRWSGWARILATGIALVGLVLGGSWFYNDVLHRKELVYTVLPVYDVGSQVFTGLIVENRGRAPLTEVAIVIADLGSTIEAINSPGGHEPAEVVAGGVGQQMARIVISVLPAGDSVPIYLLCADRVALDEGDRLYVRSKEVGGESAPESLEFRLDLYLTAFVVGGACGAMVMFVREQSRRLRLATLIAENEAAWSRRMELLIEREKDKLEAA